MNTLSLDTITRNLNRMGALGVVIQSVSRVLEVIAVAGAREGFQHETAPDGKKWKRLAHPRPDGSDKILQDRGRLKASIKAKTDAKSLILTASGPGADTHQYGATIRPRLAKLLAIPLTKEAKRAGSPKDFKMPLFAIRSKANHLVLLSAGKGKGSADVVQYALVREVKVPARPFVGFSDATVDKITGVIADRVAEWIAFPFQSQPWRFFDITKLGS